MTSTQLPATRLTANTRWSSRQLRRLAHRVWPQLRHRLAVLRRAPEAGMATAEYAIATLAAAGFAGLLLVILRSAEVREFLLGIVQRALQV